MSGEHLPMAHTLFRTLMALCFAGAAIVYCSGGSWLYAAFLVLVAFFLYVGSSRTGSQ